MIEEVFADSLAQTVKRAFDNGIQCAYDSFIDYLDGQMLCHTGDKRQVLQDARNWTEVLKLDIALDAVE